MSQFDDDSDLPKYLNQSQVTKFFSVIEDPRDKALFAVIYHYGLRVSEAVGLSLSDIDHVEGRIKLHRLKNGIHGERPLWKATGKAIRTYLKKRIPRGEQLFIGRQGPLTSRRVEQLFKLYAGKAGIDSDFSVHCLRHSIAVHLLQGKWPIEMVQDHLGHRDIRNTKIYGHITDPRREQFFREAEYNPAIVMKI